MLESDSPRKPWFAANHGHLRAGVTMTTVRLQLLATAIIRSVPRFSAPGSNHDDPGRPHHVLQLAGR